MIKEKKREQQAGNFLGREPLLLDGRKQFR